MQRRERPRSPAELQLGLFTPKSPIPWGTLSARTQGELVDLLARLMLAHASEDEDDGREGEEEEVDA